MNFNQLFSMGGYGVYVWSTYSITLFVLGINVFFSMREKRQIKKSVRLQLANQNES